MRNMLIILGSLILAGCAGIHPPASPQEIADKKFEAVPGKAVVYVVQNQIGSYGAGLWFDDGTQITTWPGTFYRWVTTPGTHTIRSADPNLSARITLTNMEAGHIYFVQHSVWGIRGSTTDATLSPMNDQSGRMQVASAELCCATR